MASPLRKIYDQMNIKEAMYKPCKFERSILSHDEHEVILRSHHPEIYGAGFITSSIVAKCAHTHSVDGEKLTTRCVPSHRQ
jgi:hypothetical protein